MPLPVLQHQGDYQPDFVIMAASSSYDFCRLHHTEKKDNSLSLFPVLITSWSANQVVSLNPVHGKVYSIQHYVINLSVTCDRSVVLSGYSSTNKTDRHARTEILLKVALKHHKPKSKTFLGQLSLKPF
jgi:hypothetical protein